MMLLCSLTLSLALVVPGPVADEVEVSFLPSVPSLFLCLPSAEEAGAARVPLSDFLLPLLSVVEESLLFFLGNELIPVGVGVKVEDGDLAFNDCFKR